MNQQNTPLLDAVERLIDTEPAYFRIPGHRLNRGMSSRWTKKTGDQIFSYDVTETPYTDDLHAPEGAIREAQELLRQLYKADESFFLVNGTTCGNEAMILSAAFEGQEIMVARNAHKSAMMGLVLSGAKPVYVMPEVIADWGIQGEIAPDRVRALFWEHPECTALFLVNPTYYGICSDLKSIAEICHKNNALLLVDEAHGGHLYFDRHSFAKRGALECGADICVQSMHKVTGALTQSSVLHIRNHGVRSDVLARVAENLHLVQSTSPSYLLMISLDCARHELAMNGEQMVQKAVELAGYARNKINETEGFACLCPFGNREGMMDETRLVISARGLGISGFMLDELLFEKYGVNVELSDHENVLAIVTYANEQEDLDRLLDACSDISALYRNNKKKCDISAIKDRLHFPAIPKQILTPRQAYFAKKKEAEWVNVIGKIAGQMIAPYPPGIPVIYPGELISGEVWDYIEHFRKSGRHIHGADQDGQLRVIKIIE